MAYAVYQSGICIFGVGATREDAVNDARHWVDKETNLDDLPRRANFHGDMVLAECTDELLAKVKADGGRIRFIENGDGSIRLPSTDD